MPAGFVMYSPQVTAPVPTVCQHLPQQFVTDPAHINEALLSFSMDLPLVFAPVNDNFGEKVDMQLDSVKRKRKKKMNKHKIKKLRRSNRMKTKKK